MTHLVTNSFRTEKYEFAINNGITIVSEEWVMYCWNRCQNELFNGTEESIVESFKIPVIRRMVAPNGLPIVSVEKTLLKDNSMINEKQIETQNQNQLNDGLEWVYKCDPLRPSEEDNNSEKVLNKTNSQKRVFDIFSLNEIILKKKSEPKTKTIKFSKIHNFLGDQRNERIYVKWNDRFEFEGMPSQRPYY